MLYFLIVTITMALVETMTICISVFAGSYSLVYAIVAPFFVNFYELLVLGLMTLLLRCLPKKVYSSESKFFRVSKSQYKHLDKLNIKKWKDKVPEMGKVSNFPKDKVRSLDEKYLQKFLQETCFAELMHWATSIVGFTVLFFFPPKYYYFVLPIVLVNLLLNTLPCLIQRYNRYRLQIVYKFKTKNIQPEIELAS